VKADGVCYPADDLSDKDEAAGPPPAADGSTGGDSSGTAAATSSTEGGPPCKPAVNFADGKRLVARALRINAREWPLPVVGLAGAAASGAFWSVLALLYAKVLVLFGDTSPDSGDRVNAYGGGFSLLGVSVALALYLQTAMLLTASERLTLKLRRAAFGAMLRQEAAFLDEETHSVGVLSTQLAADVPLVKGLLGETAGTVVMMASSVVTRLFIALWGCWKVAVVTLAFTPGIALGGYVQVRLLTASEADVRAAYQSAGAVLSEVVANIRTVTILGAQKEFLARFETELDEPITKGRVMAITSSIGVGLSGMFLSVPLSPCVVALWGMALPSVTVCALHALALFPSVPFREPVCDPCLHGTDSVLLAKLLVGIHSRSQRSGSHVALNRWP